MTRLFGTLLGVAIAVAGVAGCVGDPYYSHRPAGRYDRSYDDSQRSSRHRERGSYKLPTIVCASKDGRPRSCHTDFRIKHAAIDKRYSGSPCDYGYSWGYDDDEVWVDRGCRARFVLTPAGRRW